MPPKGILVFASENTGVSSLLNRAREPMTSPRAGAQRSFEMPDASHRAGTRSHWRLAAELAAGLTVAFVSGVAFSWNLHRVDGFLGGTRFDWHVLPDAHVALPHWLDVVMLVVSWFGTNITILATLIPVSIWLWRRGRRDLVVPLAAVTAGNYLLNFFLKLVSERPRPEVWPHRGEYTWSSFPSGHAIAIMSVWPTVVWLVRREQGWHWPHIVWLAMVPLIVYSRVYLGVHWPTDVIAGLIAGAIWGLAIRFSFAKWISAASR